MYSPVFVFPFIAALAAVVGSSPLKTHVKPQPRSLDLESRQRVTVNCDHDNTYDPNDVNTCVLDLQTKKDQQCVVNGGAAVFATCGSVRIVGTTNVAGGHDQKDCASVAFTAEMIYQECAYGKVAAMKGSWPANGDGNMLVTIEHS